MRNLQPTNARMRLSIVFLFSVLLSYASALVIPTLPQRSQVGRIIHQPVQLRAKPNHIEAQEADDHCIVSTRKRGERRKKFLSRITTAIPKKKKLAALMIAVMAYLRGPSLVANTVDPNVAHAGVNVKVSGVKVEATIKDIPPLIPIGSAASRAPGGTKAPAKTAQKKVVEPTRTNPSKKSTTNKSPNHLISSGPGTLIISAGGGILAGTYARRKKDDGKEQSRKEKDDKYVQSMLKEPLVDEAASDD